MIFNLKLLILCICLLSCFVLAPQRAFSEDRRLLIADNSKSEYSIIIPSYPTEYELKAARELQKYLERVTACVLKITKDTEKSRSKVFLIGKASEREYSSVPLCRELENDEILIQTIQGKVILKGGGKKGTLYAVYEFLEAFVGCRFYTKDYDHVPYKRTLVIDAISYRYRPPFVWRVPYFTHAIDSIFADKLKCYDLNTENGDIIWGPGCFVHTMLNFVEPEKYKKDNPEYFTENRRRPKRIQLCLSNPDVLKITIENLSRRMNRHPNATHWSVSQMDNNNYCKCPDCRKIDEYEESPSGSIINFVNKVAQAFPDKTISTLAYNYSRKPPKHLVPASNVNIMLCSIECNRSKAIVDDAIGLKFVDDLAAWSRICKNIFVWDYLVQFTNLMAPFPNFHVIQPNIQLLTQYDVKGSFQQGWYHGYSEFSELRAYLIAKLLWNPDSNSDSIIDDFMVGYYGMAGQFIHSYIDEMRQNLVHSGRDLSTTGAPSREINSFLSKEQMSTYDHLFDLAEKAVGNDTSLLKRVRRARLPLIYARNEIARTTFIDDEGFLEKNLHGWSIKEDLIQAIDHFVVASEKAGVATLREFRNLTPQIFKEKSLSDFKRVKTIFNKIELTISFLIFLYYLLYLYKIVFPLGLGFSDWRRILKAELINIAVIIFGGLSFSLFCHYHHHFTPRLYKPLLFYGKAMVSVETFSLIYFVFFYIQLTLLFWIVYSIFKIAGIAGSDPDKRLSL